MTKSRTHRAFVSAAKKHVFTIVLIVSAASGAAAQQTNTFPNSGNAGIGTTTPTEPLEINKSHNAGTNLAVDNSYTTAGNGAYSGFWLRQGGANRFFFGSNNDGNTTQTGGAGAVQFWNFVNGPMLFATNNSERLRITSGGDVGIGTSSPRTRFDLKQSSDTFVGGLHLRRSSTDDTWALVTGADNSLYMGYANNASGADAHSDFTVYPLVLTGAGNVGIGTAAPDTRLTVVGAGTTLPTTYNTGDVLTLITPNDNFNAFSIAKGGVTNPQGITIGVNQASLYSEIQAARMGVATNSLILNRQGGNVGIGTPPNSAYKLDVNGAINATGIFINGTPISSGGSSQWGGTSGNPIYYTGGNVGIGTNGPSDLLEVNSTTGWGFRVRYAGDGQYLRFSANQISAYTAAGTPKELYLNVAGGNVGIGTSAPAQKLDINGITTFGGGNGFIRHDDANVFHFQGGSSGYSFNNNANSATLIKILDSGNLGIGTSPASGYKLDVNGNTNVTGNLNVTGNINAKYQDLAEWVPSSEQLSAGTVVVLDTTKSNQVISSGTAYDTRVAGVISAQPGITLGESGEGKVLVATTGRVRVKVDASSGPIQIGDLLVTSDVAGVAMKSEPVEFAGRKMHMPGTIIGKALEPLAKGKGEILVLLSLQ
jgi:hypothetical protein